MKFDLEAVFYFCFVGASYVRDSLREYFRELTASASAFLSPPLTLTFLKSPREKCKTKQNCKNNALPVRVMSVMVSYVN